MSVKRGQLAIITILVLIIIAAVIAFFLFSRTNILVPSSDQSPQSYFRSCLEPAIKPALDSLTSNGGYSNPSGIIMYKGEKIKYLCYTSEYYKTCTIQEPFIKERLDIELSALLQKQAESCKDQLVKEYERKGYSVVAGRGEVIAKFNPHELNIDFSAPITITKQSTQTFKGLSFSVKSEIYDLLMLTTSILAYEVAYGDSETTLYIQYYPDISIEKVKLSDGSKIYTVKNVVSEESFRFASRSLSWPPGYGLE